MSVHPGYTLAVSWVVTVATGMVGGRLPVVNVPVALTEPPPFDEIGRLLGIGN